MKRFCIPILLVFLAVTPALAARQPAEDITEYDIAAHNARRNPNPKIVHITILKSARKMYLLDENGFIAREYSIALGGNPIGHKEYEGDNRTPEGRYKIDFRNTNSQYYKSLRIDYPNENDRRRAKKRGVSPGGDIFIHGAPNGRGWMRWKYNNERDWTFGCIAVSNKEIDEIWRLVSNGTTVLIKP